MNKKILLFLLMLLPLVTSAQTSRTIHVAKAGTLSDYISEDEKYQIDELTLSGELNGTDIYLIRQMAGIDYSVKENHYNGGVSYYGTDGMLKSLDISNARIIQGGNAYMATDDTFGHGGTITEIDWCYYYTKDDCISTLMFYRTRLETIILPNSITSIGGAAFNESGKLTSIKIPKSVKSIDISTSWIIPNSCLFSGCTSLTSIEVDDGNTIYDSRDECNAIISTNDNTIIAGCKNTKIPNSVTGIGAFAFYDCSGLTTLTLPNSLTSIGEKAFSYCSSLTSITIPNSVTTIGSDAFNGCNGLTTIISEIENPFAIDDYVFQGIYAKAMLIVPSGKKSAYQNTAGWKQFTNIVEAGQGGIIGKEFEDNGIRYLIRGDNTVSVVSRETKYSGDVILPESVEFNGNTYIVTAIAYNAFSGCSGLTSITLPPSIKKIGESAFDGCHLNSVHISDLEAWCHIIFYEGINEYHSSNPMEYAQHLFLNGVEVKDLIIPNSVTNIGYAAFQFCSSLTSITIPNSVTEIEYHAFCGCSGLTSLTLPNSVTSIGHQAFSLCSGLISIRIPNSVTSIIENPFEISDNVFECSDKDLYATATLIVPAGTKSAYQNTAGWNKFQNIVEVGGVGYEFEYNGICYKIGENNTVSVVSREARYSGDVVIPEQVTYNGVTYSVTTIGYLGTCTGLLSVTIPPSIISIATDAFDECDNLTAVNITDIVSWFNISFANNYSNPLSKAHHLFLNGEEVTDLVIPNSVTTIKDYSFWGCSGLTSITIIENPFEISDNVFECSDKDLYATATLIVPAGTKSAYQNTSGWNKFQNIVEASVVGKEFEDNGIRYLIGENNTVSVTSKTEKYTGDVSIPNQVTYNGDNYMVTSIGLSAFEGCEDMTSVSIPGSVTSICNGAFWECSSLKTVVIPDGVSTIGEGAFRNCFNLVSVDIPNSVTSIGSSAFGNCNNLTQITSGIENPFAIDDYVFLCDDKDLYATATLIVPAGKKSAYQNTAGWNKFQNIYHVDGVYTLTYYVDEEEYKSVTYSSGAGITPEPAPTKEGYTFSGWSEIPESMPDYDVTVTGTFTVNKYDLTYKIDGEVYVTYQIEYGTPITPEAEPTKEGYTFSGWSYIPETMPAVEVNVVGSFTINQYTITYVIDGEEYATVTVDFNSKIVPLTPPSKDGFDFTWEEYPETMPAHDITINGAYTTTDILSIAVENGKAKIFTLDGRQVDALQKGINIIRMDDGTTKKVVLGK